MRVDVWLAQSHIEEPWEVRRVRAANSSRLFTTRDITHFLRYGSFYFLNDMLNGVLEKGNVLGNRNFRDDEKSVKNRLQHYFASR